MCVCGCVGVCQGGTVAVAGKKRPSRNETHEMYNEENGKQIKYSMGRGPFCMIAPV